ncbi:MAG TPA: PAS domain S-box protein [Steroidobacteraceae bacterium]|jgi:PAS domain S-box-containing protein
MAAQFDSTLDFLSGGGVMARLVADYHWRDTPLGPIERWPQSRRATIALVLRCAVPVVTLWGEEGIMIYNDAYSVFAAARHPKLLGSKVREGWPEVADFNDNVMRQGLAGRTLRYEDRKLSLNRHGQPEDVWLNLDYSPIPDETGRPVGVMAIVIETTVKVRSLAEERRAILALKDTHGQLRRAQLAGGVGLFSIDLTNDVLYATPEFAAIFGFKVGEVIDAKDIEALILTEDRYRATTQDERRSGNIPLITEYRVRRADNGEIRAIARRCELEYDPEGRAVRMLGVVQDVTEARAMRAALEQSEGQFRTLMQTIPNQVWTTAPDGEATWFNERSLEYRGASPTDLEGEGWKRYIHPDDLGVLINAWARAIASSRVYESEFRLLRADGQYRWHLSMALPVRNTDGEITRWVGSNTDIHERKLAETQSVRDRERMWNMSQDLMLVCNSGGQITAVNPSAKRLLGWEEEDMVGLSVAEFVHPDDRDATALELKRLNSGKTTRAFENRCRTRAGDYRTLDWTAVPDSGRIHAVGRDVTEERTAVRNQERIWNLSPVLKITMPVNGMIDAANPAWSNALGFSQSETVGRPMLQFVASEERDTAADFFASLKRQRSAASKVFTFVAKGGARRNIAWTFVLENEILYGFGQDVTEQMVAEEALRQSQKMEAVGQLTGGIAHDFNNLLQGITGSLDLLRKRLDQGRLHDAERFLEGAGTSAKRAAALTHRLLAFSRRQPLDPKPVSVNPLVSAMADLLRRTLGEGVALELKLAADLWITRCDANQLESAILNIAINARDAMVIGGKLTVETSNAHLSQSTARHRDMAQGDYVCLAVTDTGSGMSEDTMARAFEPFFTTKPMGQGTGLGLSMVYGFARQSEGYARLTSGLNQGTTLRLYLPRYRGKITEMDSRPPQSPAAHPVTAHTVLVVEDEPVVRGLMMELLAELGYQGLEAGDGNSALAILESTRRIDLLISDIGLPGLNGTQLAEAARARRADLKVLFMTGYAESSALKQGLPHPAMGLITKPFDMEVMAARIREMLALR